MKVLFIYPDMITRNPLWRGYYYEGIALLSAVARAAGHDTALLHVWQPMTPKEVLSWVEEQSADDHCLIACSATENQFPHLKRWLPLLKKATGLPTIVGGVYPTLTPDKVIGSEGVDMICRGDGEQALVQLLSRLESGLDPQGVEGVWYHDAQGRVVEQPMAGLTDLSTLPPPHWEIYTRLHSLEWFTNAIAVHSGSRGCPYTCAFCCAKTLQTATEGKGNYVRMKPVKQLIAELKLYLERYPQTCACAT